MDSQRPTLHVVIAGGGFAGLRLARLLARNGPRWDAAGRAVRVTLVDRAASFTYTPLLYEVAAGKISPEHATTPYRDLLWDGSVEVRRATITGFDLERRVIHTDGGAIPYDRLILAIPRRPVSRAIISVSSSSTVTSG
ncbi:MAG: FAD-dependent oxidoreductase [Thermomicrobia bacterium]|nr:FAD-dependent oxidoreductase [Thermomicrobia bacterium]